MKTPKIAIIGGGLTGCCCAAALSNITKEITIFEAGQHLMGEASTYNEGKIHLGYTYAMDKSLNTAKLMAETALVFEKLLSSWFGKEISQVPRSSCFNYAIHKDSLLSPDEYIAFAHKLSSIIKKNFKNKNTYFGMDLNQTPIKLRPDEISAYYDTKNISAVVKTNEISIDPEAVAEIVQKNITKIPRIKINCNTEVLQIENQKTKYILHLSPSNDQRNEESFDYVINASWRSLLYLDSLIGLQPPKHPLFRLKYLVRTGTQILDLPSTTVVVGGFGDIVNFNNFFNLSWYPSGMIEWYEGLKPRKIDSIIVKEPLSTELKEKIIKGLSTIVPGINNISRSKLFVKGNWIYAPGTSDVNNTKSYLHQRTQVGIRRLGNYFSVNPGKYTAIPYFAGKLATIFKNV